MYHITEITTSRIFQFYTQQNIGYQLEISELDFAFLEYPLIKNQAFELTLSVIQKNVILPAPDSKIAETISYIIHQFFVENPSAFIIYYTANFDGKAFLRSRKFMQWYYRFNDIGLEKYDKTLIFENGIYFVTLIVKSENLFKINILDAFDELLEDTNNEK